MIEFRLLGSVDLKGPEGTLRSVLAQPKRSALLAYFAVATPNGFHRRDKLLGLFWPESDQEHGRAALRKALYFLRQSLGEDVIVSRGDEEIGLAAGAVWCDAVAFEEALEAGQPEEALELYRGDLLEGFFLSEVPEFERWLEGERERLRSRASEAAWTLAEQEEAAGTGAHAVSWAKRAVSFSPDDESALRRLLELLDRVGDRAGAVKEYEGFARRLKEEYEIEPSPETQALIAAIREREMAAADGSPERFADVQAADARAVTPERVAVTRLPERQAEPGPVSLLRVLGTYALVSLAVLVAVHIFTIQLGLPDWFFPSAVVLLLVCLPIFVATALVQGAALTDRAAAAEPAPGSVASRWLTWRNSIVGGALAFALLAVAVSGYMGMRVMGIGPWGTLIGKGVLEERDLIVLADFEDNTGDSTLALTVTEAVRVMLKQSPVVRVADEDYVGRVLQRMERDADTPLTYDLAREVAIRDGLKAVVTGEIGAVGSSYVLSSRLVVAETGETLHSFLESAADPDAIIDAVDRLAEQLRERIGESLKTIRGSPPLARLRTASLEALRLQTEAGRANWRQHDPDRALDLLNRALEIDTLFAAAYALRSTVLAGYARVRQIGDATRAYELRQRLPLRERYWVESKYHGVITGDNEAQIRAYSALVDLEPDNATWWNNLGVNFQVLREFARAEEAFRRAIELDSLGASLSWASLARNQFNQGKFDEAEETLTRYEFKLPEAPVIPIHRARLAIARGDYDAAEANLRDYGDRRRGSLWRGRNRRDLASLAQVQGKLAEARYHLRQAMETFDEGGWPVAYLETGVQLTSMRAWFLGDTARALESMGAALDTHALDSIEPLERPYAALAGFYAFAGAPERARGLLAEWETVVPEELRRPRREEVDRHLVWGAVALVEGRAEEALARFRLVQERGRCSMCGLPLLGQAYEVAGQPDSALAMYEQYLATPFHNRMLRGASPADGRDPYWMPVAYERLGELHEQRGDTVKAIYYYGKLVDLWRDADPVLQPRVEAARRAIRVLSPDT